MEVSAPLDRDAVARVLRRATDLAGTEPVHVVDVGHIEPEALVAAATEVGIPEHAVRRAITVEQLGALPPTRGALLGPAVVVVDDEIDGPADDALADVDRWLVSGHHMRRDRLHTGAGIGRWTRRRGLLGTTFRSLRHATGEGYLGDLERIDVVALDTGAGTCVIRVSADRRKERRTRGVAGAAVGGVTAVGAVAGAVVIGPWLLLAAPATVAVGAGIAAGGRRRARRLEGEIDRLLDSVEHGDRPARLAPELARRVVRG